MGARHRFVAILWADLRERTRGARFWVMLLGMSMLAWACIPPPDSSYTILSLAGGARGAYSSAWVGMALAMVSSVLLNLGGFYLVRGTLVRDFDTRVWQLLVATPMTRGGYLLAKWASHMVIFVVIIVVALGVGVVAQLVRAEDRSIDLFELVKPALLLSLPGLAVTSMAAIWFDLLPFLRRTAGNVLFFLVWLAVLGVFGSRLDVPSSVLQAGWVSDPGGMVLAARDFHRVREAQTGLPQRFAFAVGSPRKPVQVVFPWKHWPVRAMDVLGRLLWVAFAVGGVLLAAPWLDWAASRGPATALATSRSGRRLRWLDRVLQPLSRGRVANVAVAELKLYLRDRAAWWWLAALAAIGLQVLGSAEAFRIGMLLAWLLPLDALARAVLREHDQRTGALVFVAPAILWRLLLARFLTGFGLLILLTLPGLLRLASTLPAGAIAAVLVSASIVSWGLCLGALSRNARLFELVLVMAIYMAFQRAPVFDIGAGALATAQWHAIALLPAWLVLAWAWPRLSAGEGLPGPWRRAPRKRQLPFPGVRQGCNAD